MMKPKITILLAIIIFLSGFVLRLGNYDLSSPDKSLYYDDNGFQYFQESDSYYNYRLTRNMLEHGHLGDKIIDGRSWDLHSYYPPGVPVDYPPLLSYITIGFYYFLNFIGPVSLREACLWLPTIMGPLAGVIGFLFSRRISGEFWGFITGMLIVTAPLYVFKTTFGFFDTDMLNLIFPLLIVWLLFEAENATTRNKIILSATSGFLVFLFSLAWDGWLYYFYIIIMASIIYLKIEGENSKFYILPFFMISLLFIGIFNVFAFYKIFMTLPTYLRLLKGNIWYPWPDLYRNVAELQKSTIKSFISWISPLASLLGFFGMFIAYHKKINPLTKTILILWFISALILSVEGSRFLLLLIGPSSIFVGVFLKKFERTIHDTLKGTIRNRVITIFKISVIFIIILESATYFNVARGFNPMYDDYFMEAAQWINNNTPENTVIITDWSYGHFFTSEANRPVLFDGRLAYIETLPVRQLWYDSNLDPQIPTTARGYWINLALTTDNPTLSKNIFKMLATGGDNAYLLINHHTKNKTRAFTILKEMLKLDRTSAYQFLRENGFSQEETEKILDYTHPKITRPFIILITTDMENSIRPFNSTEKIIYDTTDMAIYQWNGTRPYSIIENGTEKYINKKSRFSIIIIENKTLIVNKDYRYSLIVDLLTNKREFIKVFENKKIKIYKVNF